MIESLIDLRAMERRPSLTFLWAFIVGSIAIITSTFVRSIPGVDFGFFSVLFTIIPSVYFFTVLIKREERIEEQEFREAETAFWKIHGKDIIILLFYFFGLTLAFALWGFFLPGEFDAQIQKINEIRGTGAFAKEGVLYSIFMNNLQVMGMSFVFSIIFGTGAIFIIVWNASVLGVFIGEFSKSLLHIPLVSLGFLPHGIPEIAGYLVAALSGGILSAAILRRRHDILRYVIYDSAKLLLLGVFLVAIGAVIEVYL